jgi:hypothetical protein
LASDKTVDILGHKEPRTEVYIFAGLAVVVVLYAVARKHQAATAAAAASQAATSAGAAAASGAFTDPAGNTCAAPDAVTGYCPGTPQDIAAQEQLSSGYSASGLDYGSLSGAGTNTNSSVPVFTDNGSWGQYAEQLLGSDGSDAIAAAIAKYLSGQSLTNAQVTIVEEAIAVANYPPVSGSGGFPPSMNVTTGSTTPTATTTTAPGSCPSGYTFSASQTGAAGEIAATGGTGFCEPNAPSGAAEPTAAVSNLHTTSVTADRVSLAWTPPPGSNWFYVVTYDTGNQNGPVSVVGSTTWTSPVLLGKTAYTFKVQVSPDSSGTQQLGPNVSVTATTS